jgi:hypothetical protein
MPRATSRQGILAQAYDNKSDDESDDQSPRASHQTSGPEPRSNETSSDHSGDDFTDREWYKYFELGDSKSLEMLAASYAPYTVINPMVTDLYEVGDDRVYGLLYCRVYRRDFESIHWPLTAHERPVNRIYPFWEDRNNPWFLSIYCETPEPEAENGLHLLPKVVLVRSQGKGGDVDVPSLSRAQTHVLREYINTVANLGRFFIAPVPTVEVVTLAYPFKYSDWSGSLESAVCRKYDKDGVTTYNTPRYVTSTTTRLSWARIDRDWAYTCGLYNIKEVGEWKAQVDIISDEDRPLEVDDTSSDDEEVTSNYSPTESDERMTDDDDTQTYYDGTGPAESEEEGVRV